ncbi:hypothetical protein JCM8547_001979 [Rhodosporidiobolus lusitaniae]
MTTLDPTHIPGLHITSDRSTGQAVQTSVPAPASGEGKEEQGTSALHKLAQELAEANRKRREAKGKDVEHKHEHEEHGERVPIPPIPDLRFEQGVLASLRPFIHRVPLPSSSSSSSSTLSTEGEKRTATAEKTALASTSLTAEGPNEAGRAEVDVFDLSEGVRVEWGQVAFVLVRDQVIFPLLQGALWAVGGYYLSAVWQWNRARLDAGSKGLPRPSLLKSLGFRA